MATQIIPQVSNRIKVARAEPAHLDEYADLVEVVSLDLIRLARCRAALLRYGGADAIRAELQHAKKAGKK